MTTQPLVVGLAQRAPLPIGSPQDRFRDDVGSTLARYPEVRMLVYPELHLQSTDGLADEERIAAAQDAAVSLHSPAVADLGAIAAEFGIWLCPGSINETIEGGGIANTQLLFAPDGSLRGAYRKMFPWRPFEPHVPGTDFVVADLGEHGTAGLSICYDAWYPEHTRQLAWLGADAVLNIVKTTTPDREQELVLARANAIVNQTYVLSVNCAGPIGRGRSIAVDPEGYVLAEAGFDEDTLVVRIDPAHVQHTRQIGTAGTNRIWHQFHPGDAPIPLPLYEGRIDPRTWHPPHS